MIQTAEAFESKTWKAAAVFSYLQMHLAILLITAIVPLSIITMGETDFELVAELAQSFQPFANWLIVIGGPTFFINALSVLSALSKKRTFQITMTIILILNFLFVVGVMVWSFVWPGDRETYFHDAWMEMEPKARNLIQKHYSCCGFENYTEYGRAALPESCYYSAAANSMWPDGCYDRVTSVTVLVPVPNINNSDGETVTQPTEKFHTFFTAYVISFGLLGVLQLISVVLFIISLTKQQKYEVRSGVVDTENFPGIYENPTAVVNDVTRSQNGEPRFPKEEIAENGNDTKLRGDMTPSPSRDITSGDTSEKPANGTSCCHKLPDAISSTLEKTFYWIGERVGTFPKMTILLTFLLAGSLFVGLLQRLEQASGGEGFLGKEAQIMKNGIASSIAFPKTDRNQVIIVVDKDNILTEEKFKVMLEIDTRVRLINDTKGRKFAQLCARNLHKCKQRSIFELWSFDEEVIEGLSTADILSKLNGELISPVYGDRINISSILGDVSRSDDGKITGAKAHLMYYAIESRKVAEWEQAFIAVGNARYEGVSVYVESRRSRSVELDSSYESEFHLVFGGFGLIFVYIVLMTGKFSLLEHRTYVAMMGIATAGLAMGSGIALAASLGFKWSVIHLVTPFLIIGIGVDDMFIIIQTWNTIADDPKLKRLTLPEKSGQVLKSAGVSITITSVTDLLAFAVGTSSELESFASFSVYVSASIILLFTFQCTLFFACTVLDQRRRESKLDACLPCCVRLGEDYKPSDCSQRELFATFFEDVLGRVVQILPVQIIVILLTLGLTGFMAWGFWLLQIAFDVNWYLPQDSYLISFYNQHEKYFSSGQAAFVYTLNGDFYEEREKLHLLYEKLKLNNNIDQTTLISWFENYVDWMAREKNITDIYASKSFSSAQEFYHSLKDYIMVDGLAYANNIALRDGKLIGSRFPFRHKEVDNDLHNAVIMDSVQDDCDSIQFSGQSFPFDRQYFTFAITKIIRNEVYRNIGIMLLCVYIIVLPTIASFQMSLWVILCVVFTIVDVAGSMHFAGFSIETSTIITLLLTVGLAVDYAAHIAHKFLTLRGTRKMRIRVTLGQIGPAVFHGGFSTFLALVMLSVSDLYSYRVFFTIFVCVVGYGLWNGLVFLPCVLALIGPAPHSNAMDASLSQRHLQRKIARKENEYSNGNAQHIEIRTEQPHNDQQLPRVTDASTFL